MWVVEVAVVNVPPLGLEADLLISTHSLEVSYILQRALCGEVVWVFLKLQADSIIWLCLVLEL